MLQNRENDKKNPNFKGTVSHLCSERVPAISLVGSAGGRRTTGAAPAAAAATGRGAGGGGGREASGAAGRAGGGGGVVGMGEAAVAGGAAAAGGGGGGGGISTAGGAAASFLGAGGAAPPPPPPTCKQCRVYSIFYHRYSIYSHQRDEELSRGPTFRDFVTILTETSMQDVTVARSREIFTAIAITRKIVQCYCGSLPT
jgi:hypothetical protein